MLHVLPGIRIRAVDALQGQVFPFHQVLQAPFEHFRIEQFPGHNCFFLILVTVEGGDPLLGGAVFLVRQALFLQLVQPPVPGQEQARPVADLQVFRRHGDPLPRHVVNLDHQAFRVHGHAVSKHVDHALPEDAGRQEVQSELAVFVDDRMAGVPAALIADHDVKPLRQQIHHPALAFVSPVDSHDCRTCHIRFPPCPPLSRRLPSRRSICYSCSPGI